MKRWELRENGFAATEVNGRKSSSHFGCDYDIFGLTSKAECVLRSAYIYIKDETNTSDCLEFVAITEYPALLISVKYVVWAYPGADGIRTQLYVKALTDYLIESESVYAEELKRLQPDIIMKSMVMHDVGKIAIPDKILLKPDKLDPEEYELMKTHTTRGKEIVHELGDVNLSIYLKHCEDICYGHHERWDGKGYPRQLKEYEIPLTARLAAMADVYDALVSARVYKNPIHYDIALSIIIDGKGTQFDPIMVDAVVKINNQLKEIAKKYK